MKEITIAFTPVYIMNQSDYKFFSIGSIETGSFYGHLFMISRDSFELKTRFDLLYIGGIIDLITLKLGKTKG